MTAPGVDPAARRVRRLVGRTDPAFWIGALVGGALVVWGGSQFVRVVGSHLPNAARWFVGGAILLDLAVIPVAAIVGLVVRRLTPAVAWPAVRAALLTSAVLVVFAWPLVLDKGGQPANTSLRPRPYDRNLAVALGIVWTITALTIAAGQIRRSRRPATPPPT